MVRHVTMEMGNSQGVPVLTLICKMDWSPSFVCVSTATACRSGWLWSASCLWSCWWASWETCWSWWPSARTDNSGGNELLHTLHISKRRILILIISYSSTKTKSNEAPRENLKMYELHTFIVSYGDFNNIPVFPKFNPSSVLFLKYHASLLSDHKCYGADVHLYLKYSVPNPSFICVFIHLFVY